MDENEIGFGRVLSKSFEIWKRDALLIFAVGAVVYVPMQVVIEIASRHLAPNTSNPNQIYDAIRHLFAPLASLGILRLAYSRCRNSDEPFDFPGLLMLGVSRWGRHFWAGFLAGLRILLYLLLLIVPGLIKAVKFSFIDCRIATTDDSASEARENSERLTGDRWWLVLRFLLMLWLLEFIFEVALLVPFGALLKMTVPGIFLGAAVKLAETYFIVCKGVFYFELESRPAAPAA